MPYTRSIARDEFEIKVLKLIKDAKQVSLKRNKINFSIQQLVFEAAIFQTCAALEEYVKAILEGWFYLANINNKTFKEIPSEIKYYFLAHTNIAAYKNYIINNDEKKFLKSLSNNGHHYQILNSADKITTDYKFGYCINDKKYPSVSNLKIIFNRIGIQNIFDEVNKVVRRDFSITLKSFLDIRTAIAHQSPPNLTFADIKFHLDNISKLVLIIDRVLYRHIVRTSGFCCWQTSSIIIHD